VEKVKPVDRRTLKSVEARLTQLTMPRPTGGMANVAAPNLVDRAKNLNELRAEYRRVERRGGDNYELRRLAKDIERLDKAAPRRR
jgi:hypothetical protein